MKHIFLPCETGRPTTAEDQNQPGTHIRLTNKTTAARTREHTLPRRQPTYRNMVPPPSNIQTGHLPSNSFQDTTWAPHPEIPHNNQTIPTNTPPHNNPPTPPDDNEPWGSNDKAEKPESTEKPQGNRNNASAQIICNVPGVVPDYCRATSHCPVMSPLLHLTLRSTCDAAATP